MATKKKSKKKSVFVVTATEFGYNDEVYTVEGDGGQPLNAFFDEDDAKAYVGKETVKWLRGEGNDLANFGYGISDIFRTPPECIPQEDQDTFFDEDHDAYIQIEAMNLGQRSDEDLLKIAQAMRFSPFTIYKVTAV